MSKALPERTQIYQDLFTDSERWVHFEHRPDDIFVCTPPKCGTTWTQAICALLVFQTPDLQVNPAEISPWFDAIFTPIEESVEKLASQTHRRIIKTHTPLDGIPYFEDVEYVCVYRDPRDAFFSLRNHIDNMKIEVPRENEDASVREAFRDWFSRDFVIGEKRPPGLAEFTHHLDSFRAYEELPNICFYHYSDLSRDLRGEMGRMADQLRITVDPRLLDRLAETADFEHMRKNADRFAPGADRDAWHDTARFFHKGTSGQWRDEIPREDEAAFREALGKLLPEDWACWLLDGRGATNSV